MTTFIIAFLFTLIVFGFFLYAYVWQNRYATHIRLSINDIDGRVISLKRELRTAKKKRMDHPEDSPSGIFMLATVEWHIVYKDRSGALCETRCRRVGDHLHWDPPLK